MFYPKTWTKKKKRQKRRKNLCDSYIATSKKNVHLSFFLNVLLEQYLHPAFTLLALLIILSTVNSKKKCTIGILSKMPSAWQPACYLLLRPWIFGCNPSFTLLHVRDTEEHQSHMTNRSLQKISCNNTFWWLWDHDIW